MHDDRGFIRRIIRRSRALRDDSLDRCMLTAGHHRALSRCKPSFEFKTTGRIHSARNLAVLKGWLVGVQPRGSSVTLWQFTEEGEKALAEIKMRAANEHRYRDEA